MSSKEKIQPWKANWPPATAGASQRSQQPTLQQEQPIAAGQASADSSAARQEHTQNEMTDYGLQKGAVIVLDGTSGDVDHEAWCGGHCVACAAAAKVGFTSSVTR